MENNRIATQDNEYAGVEQVAQWYERNLRIFCILQRLAERHKRIFALYGSGHLKLIRVFIRDCDDMTLLDTYKLLFD